MWKLKILIQFILAYLPKGEQINYLLQKQIGSHSQERIKMYILENVKRLTFISEYVELRDSSVLEIGTGWNGVGALLLYLMGAKVVYTYDHIPHVRWELLQTSISEIEKQIDQISLITSIPYSQLYDRLVMLKNATSLNMIFERANIIYKAPGDARKSGLPDKSMDLVYSNAVLEHVPEQLIHDLTIETRRILKQNGVAYHAIGLHDHYVSFDKKLTNVNFLKYPEWVWALFIKNRISYHNRLREKQFIEIFKLYGAKIEAMRNKIDPHDLEVLKTMRIDKRFSGMTHEELATYHLEVVLSF